MAASRPGAGVDRIEIVGLEVWAHHGVLLHEQALGQRFVIDVAVELDLAAAMASDDLADTLDYGVLAQEVHTTVTEARDQLIERVAQRVLDVCLADDRVAAAEVTVHKPSVPLTVPAAEVLVRVRRERDRS
ncbi:MAG: dihydroneopterin aldolase [Actinobacteria bacterium]|nr:dihydroneopterin aldolase [Actinomycetota bacterium]